MTCSERSIGPKALGKPRGSSFVIEAKKVDGAEFLVGHRVAHQVVSSG
jgi:hypothetical protein